MGKSVTVILAAIMLLTVLVPVSSATQTTPTSRTLTPIKHVVEIMMENHAFDNFFGIYPHPFGMSGSNPYNLTVPLNLLSIQNSSVVKTLKPVPNGSFSTENPIEGYIAYHGDWNNGLMNGFVNYSGPQSMVYFTASQLAPIWALAEQYALADNYFASALTETTPNRLYNVAGFSPVMNDYGPPPYIPFNQTIFGELQSNNVSWGYYVYNSSINIPTLDFLNGIGHYGNHLSSWSSFYSDLSTGNIPAVSYVMPVGGGGTSYDMASPQNILKGEMWLMYTISQIMKSPAWNSTAIFLNFDEGGGFYDQVAPPAIGGHQLGQRVPMIMISPYAKENYVSNTEMNHASILAFIDYNWNLPALNRFVSLSNLPLDMFNFNTSYSWGSPVRPALNISTQSGFPVPSTAYFTFNTTSQSFNGLFPMLPQVAFSKLNYSRTGSSDFNLSQTSSTLFVHSNTVIYPVFFSNSVMLILATINIGMGTGLFYVLRRRRN